MSSGRIGLLGLTAAAVGAIGAAVAYGGEGGASGFPGAGFGATPPAISAPAPSGTAIVTVPPVVPPSPTAGPSTWPSPQGQGGRAAAPLAGRWAGRARCDNGEQTDSEYRVAQNGNPIYHIDTKTGPRDEELTHVGQTIRWIPREGGVNTAIVDSLNVAPERIRYTMRLNREQTVGNTLTQANGTLATDAVRAGALLDVQVSLRTRTIASQPGIVTPPADEALSCRGSLARA